MKCEKASFGLEKAKRMVRGIGNNGKEMRYYKCEVCFKYHLTSETRVNKLYNWNKKRMANQFNGKKGHHGKQSY